jgi:hypothetical protein
MYIPGEGEDRVPANVIRAVMAKGAKDVQVSQMMMDTSKMLPVTFPFAPSAPDFGTLELPTKLNLEAYISTM